MIRKHLGQLKGKLTCISARPLAYSQIDYGKVFRAIFQLSNLVG